ncbi:MAG: carbamoyltransferase, partial [Candidatus Hydrogenedentes bacterium]|nr:carbamoyltransferase [Candidatus Hydrogenedentota bacterium]
MNILGISAFYHDSAAALVVDGEIVAAAQEERFTRKKHDPAFPSNAVRYCLDEARIKSSDLDYVAFYDKPFIKFERILLTYLSFAPAGIRSYLKAMPLWLKQKLFMRKTIRRELDYEGPVVFTTHHESHAASAFFPSPFQEAAILTIDGVGEWSTATFGIGSANTIDIKKELNFPHSLGLLYSAFTYFTGFRVNSGEYKLMGLAPYGEPRYVNTILDELVDLKEDGSLRLNLDYFDYCAGLRMTNRRFAKLFGGPARKPETRITRREMDIARSIQVVTEEVVTRMARHVHEATGMNRLCMAGGVALNCVANGRVLREGPFDDIWIQPAAGDAGGALGAALFTWFSLLGNTRTAIPRYQNASYLGPSFEDDEIEEYLTSNDIPHVRMDKPDVAETVAGLIDSQHVVGWFQGRMEFGPRALGARSILGDPRSPEMQSKINLKIKFRESFRPFAPTVLEENAADFFELDGESPYMLIVAPVKKERLRDITETDRKLDGLDRRRVVRSDIPAVTHVDNSARVQTVRRDDNPLYHDLISAFGRRTGYPLVINTSFNVRGEPIVCTPQDA